MITFIGIVMWRLIFAMAIGFVGILAFASIVASIAWFLSEKEERMDRKKFINAFQSGSDSVKLTEKQRDSIVRKTVNRDPWRNARNSKKRSVNRFEDMGMLMDFLKK